MNDHLRNSFEELRRIKEKAGRLLQELYASAEKDLLIAAQKYGIESNAFKKAVDQWSRAIALQRNEILYDSFEAAAMSADKAFLGVVRATYGVIPIDLKALKVERASIIRQVRSLLRNPNGQYINSLSKNWWAWGFNHKQGRARLLAALARQASIGKSAISGGTALFEGNILQVGKMPKYLRELESLARQARRGGLFKFQAAVEKAKLHVDSKLGRLGIEYLGVEYPGQNIQLVTRGFKKEFISGLEKFVENGSKEQLAATITKYGNRQAVYNGRVLQRSATNLVFQTRSIERIQESNYVEGGRWILAPARNFTDVCDDYAYNDHSGLGPGVFKPNEIPGYPHYSCACAIEPVLIPNNSFWSMVEDGKILI